MSFRIDAICAATHTPFADDGSLNLPVVDKQAERLLKDGVSTVFIGGTTGESLSLSLNERLALADRWMQVAKGTPMRVIVHVGSNCLEDSKALAAQAGKLKADAISAVAPSYFKPRNLEATIAWDAAIANEAPGTPFYHYDIPPLTGVTHSMPDFLEQAGSRIPSLAGVKFSNPDQLAYQLCLAAAGGKYDIPWGIDEYLLGAVALGATSAVGSSYNFAAPIYLKMLKAWKVGDMETARTGQLESARLIQLLISFGYMAAAKYVMGLRGVPVGRPRMPFDKLTAEQEKGIREGLERVGFQVA